MSYKTIGTGVYQAPSPNPPEPMCPIIIGEISLLTVICDVAESMDLVYINAAYEAIQRYLQDTKWIAISMCFSIVAKLDDAISHAPPPIGAAKKRIADLFRAAVR